MIIIKILIAVAVWALCNFGCKKIEQNFPDEYTEYDRVSTYMSIWMLTFFILLIILSLF